MREDNRREYELITYKKINWKEKFILKFKLFCSVFYFAFFFYKNFMQFKKIQFNSLPLYL